MGVISMKALLEAGVHFGHQTRRWNPKMGRYIYTSRNGIHIIDLQKTSELIDIAYKALFDIVAEGGEVLFVGTKKQSQDPIKEAAIKSGQYYVTQRWLGGTLTNFKTIKRSIKKLHDLYKMETDGTFDVLPKKEVIMLRKDMARLEKFLGGIKDMKRIPKAMFIVDPRKERNAILEARKLHIPVFGIVDTNCDPDDVDYIIPANDDALRSVRLIVEKMADAVTEGRGGIVEVKPTETRTQRQPARRENRPQPVKNVQKETKPVVVTVKAEPKKAEVKPTKVVEVKPVAKKVEAKPTKVVEVKPVAKKAEAKPTKVVEVKPVAKKAEAKPTKEVEVKPVAKKVEAKPTKVVEVKPVAKKAEAKPAAKKAEAKPAAKKAEAKPTIDLDSKNVAELKALAKEHNLSGYSKLRKAELITELKKLF